MQIAPIPVNVGRFCPWPARERTHSLLAFSSGTLDRTLRFLAVQAGNTWQLTTVVITVPNLAGEMADATVGWRLGPAYPSLSRRISNNYQTMAATGH